MQQHNLPEQWERHGVAKSRWTVGTYLAAAIWSLLCLCGTFWTLIVVFFWSVDVGESNSENSWGDPDLSLTRAEVIAHFFPLWWPLGSIALCCGLIFVLTRVFFYSANCETRRFAWGLTLLCGTILLWALLVSVLEIWHKYGAPLPR